MIDFRRLNSTVKFYYPELATIVINDCPNRDLLQGPNLSFLSISFHTISYVTVRNKRNYVITFNEIHLFYRDTIGKMLKILIVIPLAPVSYVVRSLWALSYYKTTSSDAVLMSS